MAIAEPAIARTHSLLPDFLHEWRVDRVEVIGEVLTEVVEEARARVFVAVDLGLPLNTVRNLCERHRGRAELLFEGYGRLAVARGADLVRLPKEAEKAALEAAREGWEQACRRWGESAVGGRWHWWSRASGGRPLGRRPPTFVGSASIPRRPEDGSNTTKEAADEFRPVRTNRPRPLPGHC